MSMLTLATRLPDSETPLGAVTAAEILLLVVGGLLTIAVAVFLIVMIGRKQFLDK
tara:strand:- start:263 stop:427 length:165 start_codon:yes stop_codon:yes gene_type:complete